MAKIDNIIPFFLKWETSVVRKKDETLEELFERARQKGWANDPLDHGGATMCGVTIGAYRTYCRQKGYPIPTAQRLHDINFEQWKDVLALLFWQPWKADSIHSQSVAEICVDWGWASGTKTSVKQVQRLLGVTADGIVGPVTLAAINGTAPLSLFYRIREARVDFANAIVRRNPSQRKWLRGWLNRINDIPFSEE